MFWLTYLTIALIVLFACLTLYASFAAWRNKNKKKGEGLFLVSAFAVQRNMKHFEVRPN